MSIINKCLGLSLHTVKTAQTDLQTISTTVRIVCLQKCRSKAVGHCRRQSPLAVVLFTDVQHYCHAFPQGDIPVLRSSNTYKFSSSFFPGKRCGHKRYRWPSGGLPVRRILKGCAKEAIGDPARKCNRCATWVPDNSIVACSVGTKPRGLSARYSGVCRSGESSRQVTSS